MEVSPILFFLFSKDWKISCGLKAEAAWDSSWWTRSLGRLNRIFFFLMISWKDLLFTEVKVRMKIFSFKLNWFFLFVKTWRNWRAKGVTRWRSEDLRVSPSPLQRGQLRIFFNASSSLTGGRQVNPLQTNVVGTSAVPFSIRKGNQFSFTFSCGSRRLRTLLGR